ncbi:MAG TPA: four helix bundle protein [Roseiflexaceae bacterium]|nr:four helix bundle protein [Roseiflexaceae bacterium]
MTLFDYLPLTDSVVSERMFVRFKASHQFLVKNTIMQGFHDLKVYQKAYQLAMQIFDLTKSFPKEERYALTDQLRRSSRSVAANIAEGYRKRQYPKMFLSKLADADGEVAETQVWIDFALECGYLAPEQHSLLMQGYQAVGRMLGSMLAAPEKFLP